VLITFQSRATPDVLMLKDLAGYLLGLVGKRMSERGVITHGELPGAIRRLEDAIAEDDKFTEEHSATHHAEPPNQAALAGGLSQRAFPFLDMMREAHKQGVDIIWGL
jgi:hypothetical protein